MNAQSLCIRTIILDHLSDLRHCVPIACRGACCALTWLRVQRSDSALTRGSILRLVISYRISLNVTVIMKQALGRSGQLAIGSALDSATKSRRVGRQCRVVAGFGDDFKKAFESLAFENWAPRSSRAWRLGNPKDRQTSTTAGACQMSHVHFCVVVIESLYPQVFMQSRFDRCTSCLAQVLLWMQ